MHVKLVMISRYAHKLEAHACVTGQRVRCVLMEEIQICATELSFSTKWLRPSSYMIPPPSPQGGLGLSKGDGGGLHAG